MSLLRLFTSKQLFKPNHISPIRSFSAAPGKFFFLLQQQGWMCMTNLTFDMFDLALFHGNGKISRGEG